MTSQICMQLLQTSRTSLNAFLTTCESNIHIITSGIEIYRKHERMCYPFDIDVKTPMRKTTKAPYKVSVIMWGLYFSFLISHNFGNIYHKKRKFCMW